MIKEEQIILGNSEESEIENKMSKLTIEEPHKIEKMRVREKSMVLVSDNSRISIHRGKNTLSNESAFQSSFSNGN